MGLDWGLECGVPNMEPRTRWGVSLGPTGNMQGSYKFLSLWADILTKPIQGQKFRDMHAFLQNCPRDYDNDAKLKLLMKPQDVASLQECVDEHGKIKTKSWTKSRATSPMCVTSHMGPSHIGPASRCATYGSCQIVPSRCTTY